MFDVWRITDHVLKIFLYEVKMINIFSYKLIGEIKKYKIKNWTLHK